MAPDSRRVLLAEDDTTIRELLVEAVAARGYSVTAVKDGAAAIDELRSEAPYEVLILDMMMPVSDGPAVLEFMSSCGSRIPVIVMSGGGEGALGRATHAVVKRRFHKPFDVEELVDTVDDLAGQVGRSPSAPQS